MPPAAFAGSIYQNDGLVLPPAVFLVRARTRALQQWGIQPGDMLVIDRAQAPVDGSLVVAFVKGQFVVRQYRTQPTPTLLDDTGHVLPAQQAIIWGRVDQRVRNHGSSWEELLQLALQPDRLPTQEWSV